MKALFFLSMVAFTGMMLFAQPAFAQIPGVPGSVGQPGVSTPPRPTNPFLDNLSGDVSEGLPAEYLRQETRDPIALVNRLIRIALSFVGIILVALMVRAGYLWMTAAGNDEQVSMAKTSIRNATMGLIVIFCAYSFVWFIGRRVQTATQSYGKGGLLQSFGNLFTR